MTWQEVFDHPEAYPKQTDGTETVIRTAQDDGFAVAGGACGTDRTMFAFTAGVDLIRDSDSDCERVFVLMSVKQQLRRFEADLRTINENLPTDQTPILGLTLVGRSDVCPYSRESCDDIDDVTVHSHYETPRDRTRGLVSDGDRISTGALARDTREQQTDLLDTDSTAVGPNCFETVGGPTSYPTSMPKYEGVGYYSFYVDFLADFPKDDDPIEAVPFNFDNEELIGTEDLIPLAADAGSYPHPVTDALLPHVEAAVSNHYHTFDPATVGTFTGTLADDSTFVICSEAHVLEPHIRDLISVDVGDRTLHSVESGFTRIIQPMELDGASKSTTDVDLVRGELQEADVTLRELEETHDFIRNLREESDRYVTTRPDRECDSWRADPIELDGGGLPLHDSEESGVDELVEWAEECGRGEGTRVRAEATGSAITCILDSVEEGDKRWATPAAGWTFLTWVRVDCEKYSHEIELERTWDEMEPSESWWRTYNAWLSVHNCVPGEAIMGRLGGLGSGILMSAMLEPIDVFRRATDLDAFANDGRPVAERTFNLGFPKSSHANLAADMLKFTHSNRGPPSEGNGTRLAYTGVAAEMCERSPGNALAGISNYAEAGWMAGALETRVDKPALFDESSDDSAMERLKRNFFGGERKVLVTNLRGTLTEGTGYSDSKLSAAVVCGIPFTNTSSSRAHMAKTAYDRKFGDGLETASAIPVIRKARQAIGCVIRGTDEVGIRVFVDAQCARDLWNDIRDYLPTREREKFRPINPDILGFDLSQFRSSAE